MTLEEIAVHLDYIRGDIRDLKNTVETANHAQWERIDEHTRELTHVREIVGNTLGRNKFLDSFIIVVVSAVTSILISFGFKK